MDLEAPPSATSFRPGLSRRAALVFGIGAAAGLGLLRRADAAEDTVESHGLSVFDDHRYPPDFEHFDYVNPDAPVGGTFSYVPGNRQLNQNFLTFNSLNTFILRGDAALKMDLTFASLMTQAYDEPDAMYGLAARAVRHDASRRVWTFLLRPNLTFHDGSPLTVEDVFFSIRVIKAEGHPFLSQALRDVTSFEITGPDAITIRLAESAPRNLPLQVASLPILSKAYYATHSFNETTMEPPLASGPYKVGRFEQGRFIEYDRVADWWGWRVPAMRGQYNWRRIRIEYFRDRDIGFEGFKSGQFVFREEFTSRSWAKSYDFPAFRDGLVKKEAVPDARPSGAQGWFFNLRRAQFADPRVREAIGLCFDFEFTNKNLFYGLYKRNASFFENSDMVARGMPSEAELAFLEPFRAELPNEVFGEAVVPPTSDGTGSDRANLKRALELLRSAGVTLDGGQAKLASGQRLAFEFLETEASFERVTLPFIENLKRVGIDARIRRVDPSQYESRIKEYDFDIVSQRFPGEVTPGDLLRRQFSSADADRPGSYNPAGIKSSVVDALVETAVAAKSREELYTVLKALDRVLRVLRPWVPHWHNDASWLAYWDVFGKPETKPRFGYSGGAVETWWIDQEKATRLGKGL